jgi:hypothetical protein
VFPWLNDGLNAARPGVVRWQRRLNRIQMTLAFGCHLTRPIADLIERNGFRFQTVRRFFAPKMPRTHGGITVGIAVPAS